jgi:hypothetical protein
MEEFGVDVGQESANCVDQVEARQLLELFLSFQRKRLVSQVLAWHGGYQPPTTLTVTARRAPSPVVEWKGTTNSHRNVGKQRDIASHEA